MQASFKGMPSRWCAALDPCILTQRHSKQAKPPSPAENLMCRELGGGDLPAGGAWAWAAGAEAVRWARSAVWSRAFNLRCLGAAPRPMVLCLHVSAFASFRFA